jgi:uncharacterized membrane protein YfcA
MTTSQIIFGLAVFLIAGTVKGLVGLGLPTITIALTSLVLPLPEAIALISLPTVVANLWQAAVGGKFRLIVRRQWPLIVPLMIVLYLTLWLVGQKGPNWAFLVLAVVLVVYSGLGLLRIRLHIHADLEKPLAPVIGVVSGFIAGLVGVPVVPLMPYLQGLDIKPTELVQTLGVVLCATSITLTVSLLFLGMLDGPHAIVSAAAVVPALVGMWLGQQIRLRLSIEQFRLAVFWALLLTGVYTFASRVL